MHTVPGPSDVGSGPPHPHGNTMWQGGGEAGAAAAGEFPKLPPSVSFFPLFLFENFLLLNRASPYKEGPVLSHSPPLQLGQALSRSGPNTTQLSTLPIWRTRSRWVYHFVLIPLLATSSNHVSLGAAQPLCGKGGSC